MPTKKMKPMAVWVTKDKSPTETISIGNVYFYDIYLKKPKKTDRYKYGKWDQPDDCICDKLFEEHFFKLKPGAGPVEAEITIKRRKK